jgi:hypothetical protein
LNDCIACNALGTAMYSFSVRPEYHFYIGLTRTGIST